MRQNSRTVSQVCGMRTPLYVCPLHACVVPGGVQLVMLSGYMGAETFCTGSPTHHWMLHQVWVKGDGPLTSFEMVCLPYFRLILMPMVVPQRSVVR